jgi:hypothetical protein
MESALPMLFYVGSEACGGLSQSQMGMNRNTSSLERTTGFDGLRAQQQPLLTMRVNMQGYRRDRVNIEL